MPLLLKLHLAEESAFGLARAIWARHGLTPAEFDVLVTLRNAPPPHELTPSDLQAALVITSGGLTKVMGQLEARGLVQRPRQEGDQRVKPVRLTVAGQTLVEQAMLELAAESGTWLRAILNPEEIAALSGLLGKFTDAAQ
jgi:DNA-binding MarR family transcriptional regulator